MDGTTLLADIRLMPVVVIDDAALAIGLAETLSAAGIRAIEFTLRTPAGLSAIEQVARSMPEVLVGAGSVVNETQLKQVQDAGARFAVSPGHTDALLDAAEAFPYLPGAVSAAECMHLLSRGYRLQKFFPAELSGGVNVINALSAPLPDVRFCVTGGITPDNVGRYLECPAVTCIGGSWFVPAEALHTGDFATIERLAVDAVGLIAAA
jgi:2-dehydro-3-deoxyphosphogluconate aldolase/(4S)-4-hydroxy-2-oxoglutarate aldolase